MSEYSSRSRGRNCGTPRRALIVSFDILREKDPIPSLAVGSLLAYARTRPGYGRTFVMDHQSVRVDGVHRRDPDEVAGEIAERFDLHRLDVVALAAYAWSDALIDPLMRTLRRLGFTGVFAIGGYQITQAVDLDRLYPEARYLIEGLAEEQLLRVLLVPPRERVLVGESDVNRLVSPYLTGVIDVPFGASMVRMETQRGCRWRCGFCSYRGLRQGPVVRLPLDRVEAELRLLAERGVAKVNVLDPEFNARRESLDVLRAMIRVGLGARVAVQARPENLVRARFGPEFLDLCEEIDIHLEFGLQTAIPAESSAIDRWNNLDAVSRAFYELGRRDISHEVSLIYGLPLQTVESFAASLEFVRRHGVPTIRCFPLMLHRGIALSLERERYGMREEVLDAFDIPFVTSSSTFTRADWDVMRDMADAASSSGPSGSRVSPARTTLPGAAIDPVNTLERDALARGTASAPARFPEDGSD
jgi:radical SAM superfamily enzyme YgiQ (UPF0313 family)